MKMYKKIIISSIILSGVLYAKSDKTPKKEPFKTLWQKIYGGSEDDIAYGVVMLEKGDFAVVGECKSAGAIRGDICIARMDKNGDTKWRTLIKGKKEDKGVALSRAKDGNLLILGNGKSFNDNMDKDLLVAKVSLDGKILWQKRFGGNRDEYAGGIAGTDDGGVLVVGDSESFSKRGYKDIYIIRLDKNGKKISEKIIGGKRNETAKALTRTVDGNFIMVGAKEVGRAGNSDFFLLKLNQNGEKIWAKSFGEENFDILNSVAPTPDGGIVVTGATRSFGSKQTDLSVMYFDKKGKLIWHKIYGYKYYDGGSAITVTPNGGYMVAGKTNSIGEGGYDIYVIALNNKGSLIWSKLYGGERDDIAHGISRTSDGAIIIVGESDSFIRSKNFYMIKIKQE